MSDNAYEEGRGLQKADQETRERVAHEGGKASAKSSKGAAGKTEAAKRGGEHSHSGGRRSE